MIQLTEIFQPGMTLQRNKPIRIWGTSEKENNIRVTLNGALLTEETLPQGKFQFYLPPQEAMEDAELRFEDTSTCQTITLTSVDFGEIWIAGGQSNMEFLLKYDKEAESVIPSANDSHFRFYDVGKWAWSGEKELGLKDAGGWDHWISYKPETAGKFSAVAVYFALRLRQKLGVPVGIVGCNWGGTSASCWVNRESLEKDSLLQVYTERFDKDIQGVDMEKYLESLKEPNPYASNPKVIAETEKRMKNEITSAPGLLTRIVGKIIVATSKMTPYSEYRPGGLYETMVKPIAGFTASGFLWYQGESDYNHGDVYDRLLSLVIHTWRKDWDEELPFLLVQLTSYEGWPECSGENYEIIRAQQQKVADTMAGVYLASIMDVGSRYDIHPKEKRPVGARLAALALNHVYGIPTPCDAPRVSGIRREQGGLTVTFAHAESGLMAKGDLNHLFKVRIDGKPVPVNASLRGSEVLLKGAGLSSGKAEVSFAYERFCPMTLFNHNGLSARPSEPMQIP